MKKLLTRIFGFSNHPGMCDDDCELPESQALDFLRKQTEDAQREANRYRTIRERLTRDPVPWTGPAREQR